MLSSDEIAVGRTVIDLPNLGKSGIPQRSRFWIQRVAQPWGKF